MTRPNDPPRTDASPTPAALLASKLQIIAEAEGAARSSALLPGVIDLFRQASDALLSQSREIERLVDMVERKNAKGQEAIECIESQARDLAHLTEKNDQQRTRIEKMSDEIESRAYGQEKGALAFEALRVSVARKDEALRYVEVLDCGKATEPWAFEVLKRTRAALAEKGGA